MAVKWLFVLSTGYKYPLKNQGYSLSNSGKKVQLLADAGEVQERARGGCAGASMGGRDSRGQTRFTHTLFQTVLNWPQTQRPAGMSTWMLQRYHRKSLILSPWTLVQTPRRSGQTKFSKTLAQLSFPSLCTFCIVAAIYFNLVFETGPPSVAWPVLELTL